MFKWFVNIARGIVKNGTKCKLYQNVIKELSKTNQPARSEAHRSRRTPWTRTRDSHSCSARERGSEQLNLCVCLQWTCRFIIVFFFNFHPHSPNCRGWDASTDRFPSAGTCLWTPSSLCSCWLFWLQPAKKNTLKLNFEITMCHQFYLNGLILTMKRKRIQRARKRLKTGEIR